MSSTPETSKTPQILASIAIVVAVVTMIGWHTRSIALLQLLPGTQPIVYNTAIELLLASIGIIAMTRRRNLVALGCGSLILLLAALTLIEHFCAVDLGIDQFIVSHDLSIEVTDPGRMALNTSVAFLLVGAAISLSATSIAGEKKAPLTGLSGCLVFVMGVIPFLGHLGGWETASGWGDMKRMAIQTAFGLLCIGAGLILLSWDLKERSSRRLPTWAPYAIGIAGIAGTIILWQGIEFEEIKQVRELTQAVLSGQADAAKSRLEGMITSLQRFVRRWERRVSLSKQEWDTETRDYLLDFPELQAIELVGATRSERWTTTLKGNDESLEREFPLAARQQFEESFFSGAATTMLSSAIDFSNGEKGFVAVLPFHHQKNSSAFIVGIFRFRFLFRSLSASQGVRGFLFRAYLDGEEIYADSDQDTHRESRLAQNLDREILGKRFRFRSWPGRQYLGKRELPLGLLTLVAGAALSLLLSFSVFLSQVNRMRYREVLDAEAELRESEARKRTILESAAQGIITIDSRGRILESNPAVTKLFDYSQEELLGKNVNVLMPSPVREEHDGYIRNYQETGIKKIIGFPREVLGRRKSGATFPLLLAVSEAKTERATLYTGILHDLSKLKEVQDSLQRKADELARSNAELERFAYVASHDLQEPLRMITNFLQLLEEEYRGKLSPEADKWIYYAVDGGKRMKNLIQDLLAFSRVGRKGIRIEDVEIASVVEEALSNLKQAAEDAQIAFEVGPLPVIRSDRTQLVMLFQNLVGNAIKFRSAEDPKITIRAVSENGIRQFQVIDNGIGIPPEHRKKVFDLFARLHGAGKYPGTGLGLAICKKIVDWHGGEIWVESDSGKGTKFCFTLPAISENRFAGEMS